MFRIGIVEDSAEVAETWIQLLGEHPGYQCVGTFNSGEDALQKLPDLEPDVVLMDISLPGMSGIECVSRLKRKLPRTPILMVTVHSDNDRLFQALKAGANGYLLKRATPDELVDAIDEVLNGGAPMTGEIARRVIEAFSCPPAAADCNLSGREKEVIELLARGYSDKEIAEQLKIGFTTVRSHLGHIFAKLHVRSRMEAVSKLSASVLPAPALPRKPG